MTDAHWNLITALVVGIFSSAFLGLVLYILRHKYINNQSVAETDKIQAERGKADADALNSQMDAEKKRQEIAFGYEEKFREWDIKMQEVERLHRGDLDAMAREKEELTRDYLQQIKTLREAEFVSRRRNVGHRRLLNRMDAPYWETEANGKVTFVNGALQRLFGAQLSQLREEGWLTFVVERERAALQLEWNSRLTDGGDDTNGALPLRFTLLHPVSGRETPVQALYETIYDMSGNLVGLSGITLPDNPRMTRVTENFK